MAENIRISKKMKEYINLYKYIYSEVNWVSCMSDQDIILAIMQEWENYNPLLKYN